MEETKDTHTTLPLSRTDIILTVLAILYNFVLLLISVKWIFTNSFSEIKKTLSVVPGIELNERLSYTLFFSGVLGGSFYCLRAIYLRLADNYSVKGKNQYTDFNIRVWLFWYLFRPWQGGVLALIIMCLVNGNLLAAKNLSPEALKSFYSLIAVGFLAGLGTNEVIQKIQEIIAVVFARSKAGEQPQQPAK